MYGMGHGMALHAIIALVVSTAFLVWLGGKEGAPFVKFGKVIAWIAVVLTGLMVIGSVVMCATHCGRGGWRNCGMRGEMMEEMMEKGGMPMEPGMMHPGMKMGPGMGKGQMEMPPPAEEQKK